MVSDDQFNELADSTQECIFVTLICAPPLDDILVLVSSEIQAIFIDMPALDFVATPTLVTLVYIQQDEYYEVFPLSTIS